LCIARHRRRHERCWCCALLLLQFGNGLLIRAVNKSSQHHGFGADLGNVILGKVVDELGEVAVVAWREGDEIGIADIPSCLGADHAESVLAEKVVDHCVELGARLLCGGLKVDNNHIRDVAISELTEIRRR